MCNARGQTQESDSLPQEARPKPHVTVAPGQDDLAVDASANAPIIYFDGASNYGVNNGVANVTLEASRFMLVAGQVVRDRVVVAHLRMSIPAAMNLNAALNGLALLAVPQGGRPTN
jgi:hypothetical protein